jgi:predicted amidohydrolase
MPDILIRGAEAVLTMDDARREIAGGDVLIRGGVIAAVGAGLQAPGAEVVEARGCVVTPGLVNTHHHLYQTLTRAVPGGRMRCCLAGCGRFIRSGRGSGRRRSLYRRRWGWRSWRCRAVR